MESDYCDHVKRCLKCQVYVDNIHGPPSALHNLTAPWPFSMWGLDMIGPIEPKASNGHRFILVDINYFSKWVEAASYASVTKNIVSIIPLLNEFLQRNQSTILNFLIHAHMVGVKSWGENCNLLEDLGEAAFMFFHNHHLGFVKFYCKGVHSCLGSRGVQLSLSGSSFNQLKDLHPKGAFQYTNPLKGNSGTGIGFSGAFEALGSESPSIGEGEALVDGVLVGLSSEETELAPQGLKLAPQGLKSALPCSEPSCHKRVAEKQGGYGLDVKAMAHDPKGLHCSPTIGVKLSWSHPQYPENIRFICAEGDNHYQILDHRLIQVDEVFLPILQGMTNPLLSRTVF
ncbi:hypothetical protein CR513_49549, partial [Mucuna pruriens]